MRLLRNKQLNWVNSHLIDYPTPSNISYFWSFGFLAGICLAIQLLTGIFLVMHYTPNVNLAFSSVEHIMRDVNGGWILWYVHANGASVFFIILYIHIVKGLYYGSYLYPQFFGMPGSMNDINVLQRSPLLHSFVDGLMPKIQYEINGDSYPLPYWLVDGI